MTDPVPLHGSACSPPVRDHSHDDIERVLESSVERAIRGEPVPPAPPSRHYPDPDKAPMGNPGMPRLEFDHEDRIPTPEEARAAHRGLRARRVYWIGLALNVCGALAMALGLHPGVHWTLIGAGVLTTITALRRGAGRWIFAG